MRFTLRHPTDTSMRAVLGHDRTALGFFLEVRRAGRIVVAYDGLRVAGGSSISGVLSRLTQYGVVTKDDVGEAWSTLAHMDVADITDPDTRRAAEVIEQLRAAASEG